MTNYTRQAALGLLILTAAAFDPSIARGATLTISVDKNVEGAAGAEVKVTISVKGAKDLSDVKRLSGAELRLNYDPALLTLRKKEPVEKGKVLPKAMVSHSVDEKADPGKLGIVFMCDRKSVDSKELASVEQDGELLVVTFVVNDGVTVGKKGPLKLDQIRAVDSDEPPYDISVDPEEGQFTVTGPAAAFPWLWILIGAGVVLLLILLVVLAKRGGQKDKPVAAVTAQGTVQGTVPPRFSPQATTFTHTCVKCGGAIQLPSAMIGQSFQCGACGTTQIAGPR
jgi:hypothetical protein